MNTDEQQRRAAEIMLSVTYGAVEGDKITSIYHGRHTQNLAVAKIREVGMFKTRLRKLIFQPSSIGGAITIACALFGYQIAPEFKEALTGVGMAILGAIFIYSDAPSVFRKDSDV